MNSIESIKPDELIEEYGEWLKHESSAKDLGEWKEITLPMFDHSNDDLIFYAKTAGDRIMFTDDGYTLESFRQNGVTITEARRERMERIARKYGAGIKNDEIVLESDGRRGDAMNRYAQALIGVGSMMEAAQRRVAEYFADDVATVLDGCNVFYTASVGIRGVSRYISIHALRKESDARLLRHVPSRAEWQSWRRIAGLSGQGGLISTTRPT